MPAAGPSVTTLADDTLYWSANKSFAVFDWFIVKSGHLVALQFTVSASHAPTYTALGKLFNSIESLFGTGTWSKFTTRSIVFVQRPGDTPIVAVQQLTSKFTQQTIQSQYVPKHLQVSTNVSTVSVGKWNTWANNEWATFAQFQSSPPP